MDHAWLQSELHIWRIEGNEPVAADHCQAAFMLCTSRSLFGLPPDDAHVSQGSQPDPGMDLLKDEVKALKKQLATQPVKKIELSQVLDQSLDDEVEIDRAHVVQAYEALRVQALRFSHGRAPSHDEEPSMDQVEGVKHMLQLGFPPYADFSLFNPFANRTAKKHLFTGMIFKKDRALGSS
eukprot:1182923-Amphidinium_carterae.1